jgi:hypothetical protein
MNRVLAAARLQLVHPLVILGVPWLVVSISFGLNWAIWASAGIGQETDGFTGGVLALYFTVMAVFVQTVTQLLPFAMGISLSRRTYFIGVALVGVLMALGYGVALAVLSAVETATDGWGVALSFWTPSPVKADGFLMQVLVSAAPMLAFVFIGLGIGIVYKRWGQYGVWGLIVGALLVFGGLILLITWLEAWSAVGTWLTERSFVTLSVGLPAAVAAVAALLAFAGIRRVVP